MGTKAAWMRTEHEGSRGSDDGPGTGDRFVRKQSEFRDKVSHRGRFTAEAGRYHLYVQYACPWAHRTLLARSLLGLQDHISVDVVSWRMQADGSWIFEPDLATNTHDSQLGADSLQDVYRAADPGFDGIGTVPVLWDKKERAIVNNESRDIVRMMDALAPFGAGPVKTLVPDGLVDHIDAMIDANYESINNGVYKCGFARSQAAYDEAADALWARMDAVEEHLDGRDWLVGPGRGVLTEADIFLWTTLVRFDPVYHVHFKCSRNLVRQMPALWAFTKRLWRHPGVQQTVHFEPIVNHYYWSHQHLNPYRIVPRLPDMRGLLDA